MTLIVRATPADRPSPYIDVLVTDPLGERFTVTRMCGGRSFKVRGMVNVSSAGGGTIRDHEAGFDVPSTYRVEYFTSGASVGFSETATGTLYGLEPGWAWFSDPLNPESAVKVRLLNGAASALSRSTPAELLEVPRRSVGFTLPGTRGGLKQVVLDCYTETREDGERFDALFGGYDSDALSIVCVRASPETWLPPTLFAFVGSPVAHPVGQRGDALTWSLSGDETSPPAPAFVTPLLEYDDFTAWFATYDEFEASYPDYLTAQSDYSVRGA
ncbi:hypothetical protein D6T64_12140 [Cryobacterium melibiosiphilum]|uniref:Uncharacterized protein n=1 Tax=Cryobacterium melibiosiphilum TaxID=995039 RepID=A0A3A5MJN2_9MICO|nr:hypothetical protein [Cryobacterium melibiosiphilum]RJT88129.1 hypothetical protein D6T64_12140 [Cryobacterium melibiosiphilum]